MTKKQKGDVIMPVSEAHKRASRKWDSSHDSITIRPTKEEGAAIRAAAASEVLSVQQYILQAIRFYETHQEKEAD